jgi:fructose-1,6-bisphosphatase/inositol monophosphatase family enzyme
MIVNNYGDLTGPAIGILLKEMVSRAMRIFGEKFHNFDFTVMPKESKMGREDFVTTVDKELQSVYIKLIAECFPGYGIVAEEENLPDELKKTDGQRDFLVVDPVDGTKALIRGQSHGIGTMIALICEGKIVSSYVGDLSTREIYGYRPDSQKVHRIWADGKSRVLSINSTRKLSDQLILMRNSPEGASDKIESLYNPNKGNLFKEYETTSGSIGISIARIWKGEVGGMLLSGFDDHPWDILPPLGICQQLGIGFYDLSGNRFVPYKFLIDGKTHVRHQQLLIVHKSRANEINKWARSHKFPGWSLG